MTPVQHTTTRRGRCLHRISPILRHAEVRRPARSQGSSAATPAQREAGPFGGDESDAASCIRCGKLHQMRQAESDAAPFGGLHQMRQAASDAASCISTDSSCSTSLAARRRRRGDRYHTHPSHRRQKRGRGSIHRHHKNARCSGHSRSDGCSCRSRNIRSTRHRQKTQGRFPRAMLPPRRGGLDAASPIQTNTRRSRPKLRSQNAQQLPKFASSKTSAQTSSSPNPTALATPSAYASTWNDAQAAFAGSGGATTSSPGGNMLHHAAACSKVAPGCSMVQHAPKSPLRGSMLQSRPRVQHASSCRPMLWHASPLTFFEKQH
jgi:hypothetical protein